MFNVNLRKLYRRLLVLGVLTFCFVTQGFFETRVQGSLEKLVVTEAATCCLETCCLDCTPLYLACKDECDADFPNDAVARQQCKDQCLVRRNNCFTYCDPGC